MPELGDTKVSVLLEGGIADRPQSELRAPAAAQGASLTLARSENTRLSQIPGVPVRAPAALAMSGTGTAGLECYGVAVCESGDAAVEFFLPGSEGAGLGTRAIYGEGASTSILRRRLNATQTANAYVPAVVEPVLSLSPSEGVEQHSALAWDAVNGHLWAVAAHADGRYYISVQDGSGELVAPLQLSFTDTLADWVAITLHGANGAYLWYEDLTGLRKRNVTRSGSLLTTGAETAVYTPAALGDATAICRLDDTFALILGTSSGSANDATLRRHNVTSGAETTVALAGAAAGTLTYYAVVAEEIPSLASAVRIAIAFSYATGTTTRAAVYDSALANIWGPTTVDAFSYGQCAIRFQDNADGAYVITAVSEIAGSFSTGSGGTQTNIYSNTLAAGVAGQNAEGVAWQVLANRGSQLRIGTMLYPVFFLQRVYSGPTPPSVVSEDFVDDPAIEAYLTLSAADWFRVSPIARLGCVRGSSAPARALPHLLPASDGAVYDGRTIYCSYLTSDSGVETAYQMRISSVSVVARSMHVAHDKSGSVFVAAGLPVEFDSMEVVEAGGPLYRPHLRVANSGSGETFPAGTYGFVAYAESMTAGGARRRTRISNIVSLTSAGTAQPRLSLSASWANGGDSTNASLNEHVRVRWFGTVANGITYHEIDGPSVVSGGTVTHVAPAVPVLSSPQVYSTGEAGQDLLPSPPPPLSSVAIVGQRVWGLDSERPSRAVFTKLSVPGLAAEWQSALELNFPQGGGKLQRVFELNGIPVFVAVRGTYYVTGEGPDNTGAGGFYSAPLRVSEHGCSNALALCVFPGGAVWKDRERWVVMRGMQTSYVPGVISDFDPSGAILLRKSSECVFVSAAGGAKVYNYELDRWTTWTAAAIPESALAANVPYSDDVAYVYNQTAGQLVRILDGLISEAENMVLETDWLLLAGDFQDHVIVRELVFRAYKAGAHGLTIEVFADYSATATTTRSWTNTQLDSLLDGGGSYSVRLELSAQDMRAIKIRVTDDTTGETASEGMRPVALTLYFAKFAEIREEAFVAGSYV